MDLTRCYLAHQLEGCEQVVGEDRGPAEEEDRHDQDQHVDHLDHHDDSDCDENDEQVLSKNIINLVTFLVSSSLLKVRGADAIICKRRYYFTGECSFEISLRLFSA